MKKLFLSFVMLLATTVSALAQEPAKWTDSEGNEVTELSNYGNPYYSYVQEYPTITLHLEGAVDLEDGTYGLVTEFSDIIAEGTYYEVSNGQIVPIDVDFTLTPHYANLFMGETTPTIHYEIYQNGLRDDEEAAFMPLWNETTWNWAKGFGYMQLDETTNPAAGDEYVLAKLGEMPIDEDGDFNARALKVIADQPSNGNAMVAKQITFENRSAGKMTVTFSRPNAGADLFLNVDGDKYAEEFGEEAAEYMGVIEGEFFEYGSTNSSEEVTVTFYVNPGVHTIRGHYSAAWAYDPATDPGDDETPVEVEGSDGEFYEMSAAEYHSAQEIRVYSMHFEPIVHEVTINGQYGWASLFHEHDLIVPEYADFEFYYAPTYDGTNVELVQYQPLDQVDYDGQVIQDSAALVLRGSEGTYTFYGATVGDPEELWKAGEWVAGYSLDQPEYAHFEAANIFQGVIEDTQCASLQYYVMGRETTYEGAIFQKYSGTMLGAHKVYLDLDGAAASVRLVLPGNNPIVTGVENATSLKATKALKDGKIVIRRGNKIYDVNGQML